jgi:alkylation response protein AidB-like acyl-CoA dehydrogenase
VTGTFGRESIAFMLADMATQTETSQLMVWRAA